MNTDDLPDYDGAFAVSGAVVWRDVPGDIVVFESGSGNYYAFNQSAAEIWRGLAAGLPLKGVAARLAEQFDRPEQDLFKSACAFARRAIELELLSRTTS